MSSDAELGLPAGAPGAECRAPRSYPTRRNAKATASLILGLCAIGACMIRENPVVILIACCLGGLPAIVVGVLALRDIKRAKMAVMGKGNAIAGIVFGSLTTVLALLAPLVVEGREPFDRMMCINQLKEITIALHQYETHRGTLPPAAVFDKDGKPLLSWRVLLLPYLEQNALYQQFHLDEPWDSPHNKALVDKIPSVYQCPSARLALGSTTYEVIIDPRSIFTGQPSGVAIKDVTDGLDRTVLAVESASATPWTKPGGLSLTSSDATLGMGSRHPGGFNAALAEGGVWFVRIVGKDRVSTAQLRAMVTRAANDDVKVP